jgi:hypothetical protein
MVEKAKLLVFKEGRMAKRVTVNKLGYYARDKKNIEAWYVLRKYLQHIKGLPGPYILPVDERYALPISPYQELYYTKPEILEMTDEEKVADNSCNFTRLENDVANRKARFADMMGIAVMGLVFVFIVIAVIVVKGGFIH